MVMVSVPGLSFLVSGSGLRVESIAAGSRYSLNTCSL
jgi:hypothetical protein